MYEHLRNTFLMELSKRFNSNELNYISRTLDKVASNFDISEKETELAVIEDNIPSLVKIYLATKHLEGCSKTTLNFYLNRLKIFFETVCKSPKDISTNEIRMFLF